MIKKMLVVRGIGVLHDAIEQPVQFTRVNIIYGENGRGKSTKSAIFASLYTGLSGIITGRRTSGGKHLPQVAVLIENNLHEFKAGAWNSTNPSICVFDSAFVDANVYSGSDVSSDHRRRLLDFALGEKGVDLKKKVDDLTQQITSVTSDIRRQDAKLQGLCQSLSVKNYLLLESDNEIEKKIDDAEKIVGIAREAKEIVEKGKLREMLIPSLDIFSLGTLLSRSLQEISGEVKRKVSEHIETHLLHNNERWIKEGLNLVKSTSCPFCGQSLELAHLLIEAYNTYFDQAYHNYIEELSQLQKDIGRILSDAELADLNLKVGENATLAEFWKRLVNVTQLSFPSNKVSENIKSARARLLEVVSQKLVNPMATIIAQDELEAIVQLLKEIEKDFLEYNRLIKLFNAEIENVKSQAKSSDLIAAKRKIAELNAKKERHESPNKEDCDTYTMLTLKKKELEEAKANARTEMELFTEELLKKYEDTINSCLETFGTGFRIVDVGTSNERGLPRVNYKIQLGSQKIALGSQEEAESQAVFANTLSESDKRTLALSFFLAKLSVDRKLSEQIVVIDDPVCSFDQSRRRSTHKVLRMLAAKAKQLVILSHDALFVQSLAEHSDLQDLGVTVLELRRSGPEYSVLDKCDIEERVETEYKSNYRTLVKYVTEGEVVDKKKVVHAIRPMLEANLRHRFQDSFKGAYSLGKMIEAIKSSISGSSLEGMKSKLEGLDDINEFATEFMHDSDADMSLQQLNDAELKAFAKRALAIARGT